MAAKLGFEAIKYVLTKVLTKKGVKGIATIPGKAYDMRMKQLVDEMAIKMKALGYDINKVTQKEVQGLLDSAEALAKQKPTPESLIKGKKYIDEGGRTWDFGTKDRPFPGANLKVVPKETEAEVLARMKGMNKKTIERIKRRRYEAAIKAEKAKAAKDPNYIPDVIDPEDFASGGIARLGMAGGGALFKFIEKLFIKASNDIRLGRGKWKGLDQKQRIVQHDNLTKKVVEFQKSGNTEGLEQYFGVHPEKAFKEAAQKYSDEMDAEMWDAGRDAVDSLTGDKEVLKRVKMGQKDAIKQKVIRDERTALKTKYPGLTDDLLEKILIDDNPQRKAEVLATMDEFLKLKEVGKSEEEAFNIVVDSFRKPTKHAEGGRASLMYGGDPGFAFEYGGSWADWRDRHQHQMPVTDYIKTKLPKERLPFRDMQEGGIARAGFPFGGQALKAIRAAWRANKDWGVGGPPYRPEKTSFNIKEMTKRNLGEGFTLKQLKEISESPFARSTKQPKFEEFSQEFKNIKASILKEKMMERKLEAKAAINAAEKTMKEVIADPQKYGGNLEMSRRITDQMIRESKQTLKEVREGLKEIDIYMGMLQKQGRSVHQSGGLAYMLGEPTYMKYEGGGSVGHAPWHKPSGQPQQQPPQPQPGGAQSPGRGQPNPMKAPRGIPSVAPRTMDPAFMQQQAMQKMMMGQGQPRMGQGQPRMRAAQGRFIDSVGIGPLNINPRIGISEIEEGIGPDVEKKTGSSNIGADIMLDIGKGIYGKAEYDKGRASEDIYFEGEKVLEDVPYDHDIWKYGGGFEKDGTRAEVVYDPEAERWEFKLVKSFNQGGRIGFGLGGIDKGRRAFMKWLAGITGAGIAAGSGLLKFGKAAKVAAPAVTETIVKSNAAGMPAWFPSLVKRVIKEGEDISKSAGAIERQTVHTAKTPEGTPIQVTRDLTTDDIIVDIGEQTKHGWAAGHHGQPTRLILNKGEWIEPDITKAGKIKNKKGVKTKDEFLVEEAEFTGGNPENIKFEESTLETFGNHGSNFDEIEKFATGTIKKKTGKASIKAERQHWTPEGDYASGGLAYMLGE